MQLSVHAFGLAYFVLIEVGYQARFYSADVTSTLVDSPEVQVKDRIRYRDHQILVSIGLLLGLL